MTHPGDILAKDFLKKKSVTAYRLAKETFIPTTRISQILKRRRAVTADTALRFAKFFGTTAEFWMTAQMKFDLAVEQKAKSKELSKIKNYKKI